MQIEFEAVFTDINKDDMIKKLLKEGFECTLPEVITFTKAFHFIPDNKNKWARVRNTGDRITMSIKEVGDETKIDGVKEVELSVDSFENAVSFLNSCGLIEVAFQEKKREVWKKANEEIEVMIDTWPGIPTFIEIEGKNEDIVRKYSKILGFDFNEAIFGGVDILYKKYLGISSEEICNYKNLIFDNPPKKKN